MTKKMGGKRGRPAFCPTPALRLKVERLVSCGMTALDIGRAIGCNDDTLRKHFADELACGAARRRAEILGLIYKSALQGNVSAQKKLEEISGRAVADQGSKDPAPADPAPVKPTRGGKKAADAEAAATAGEGTDWGGDLRIPGMPN